MGSGVIRLFVGLDKEDESLNTTDLHGFLVQAESCGPNSPRGRDDKLEQWD